MYLFICLFILSLEQQTFWDQAFDDLHVNHWGLQVRNNI